MNVFILFVCYCHLTINILTNASNVIEGENITVDDENTVNDTTVNDDNIIVNATPYNLDQSLRLSISNNLPDADIVLNHASLSWGYWRNGYNPTTVKKMSKLNIEVYGKIFSGYEGIVRYQVSTFGFFELYFESNHWDQKLHYNIKYSSDYVNYRAHVSVIEKSLIGKTELEITITYKNDITFFNVFIGADPQPYRQSPSFNVDPNDPSNGWFDINFRLATDVYNNHITKIKDSIHFGIVNGDLTEYGRQSQYFQFRDTWMKNIPIPFFNGLGNHDYENNVGDCFHIGSTTNDGCAISAVERMLIDINSKYRHMNNFVVDFEKNSGSLAYAFTYGNYQFVQLHNDPKYQVLLRDSFLNKVLDIKQSYEFLEKILSRNFLYNIISVHKPEVNYDERFIQLLQKYNVRVVLSGHLHETYTYIISDTNCRMFVNGALFNGEYSIASFTSDTLTMKSYNSSGQTMGFDEIIYF